MFVVRKGAEFEVCKSIVGAESQRSNTVLCTLSSDWEEKAKNPKGEAIRLSDEGDGEAWRPGSQD